MGEFKDREYEAQESAKISHLFFIACRHFAHKANETYDDDQG